MDSLMEEIERIFHFTALPLIIRQNQGQGEKHTPLIIDENHAPFRGGHIDSNKHF